MQLYPESLLVFPVVSNPKPVQFTCFLEREGTIAFTYTG